MILRPVAAQVLSKLRLDGTLWSTGRRIAILAACCIACSSDEDGKHGDFAECHETENPLRFSCTATLKEPDDITWDVSDGSGTLRTFHSGPSTDHEVLLWGLPADAELAWTAESSEGIQESTLQTGSLPSALAALQMTPTGGPASVDAMLFSQSCGGNAYLLIADSTGRLLWYEQSLAASANTPLNGITGYSPTPRGSIVATLDTTRLVEILPDGSIGLDLADLGAPLHHDVFPTEEYVYALYAEVIDDVVVDGLMVWDWEGQLVNTWSLADVLDVGPGTFGLYWGQIFPGVPDWSHANSVTVRDDRALLSLHLHDAILEIAADPTAADFGTMQWAVSGEESEVDGLTWATGGTLGQHHASWTLDGELMVFDNGPPSGTSRALRYAVDSQAGTATEVSEQVLEEYCRVQGSAYDLGGGSTLVTCNDSGTITQFNGQEAVWSMEVSCSNAPGVVVLPRAIPLPDWSNSHQPWSTQ